MSLRKQFRFAAIAMAVLALAQLVHGQTTGEGKIANMNVGNSSVRWEILAPNSGGTVTISFPDGRSIKKAFRASSAPEIDLNDKQLEGLADGVYTYELRLAPVFTGSQKDSMMKGRGQDDEPETERAARKRPVVPTLVQHGTFAVVNGALVGPGAFESERSASTTAPEQIKQTATPARVSANTITRLRNHRFSLGAVPDQVIPDDLIVQGSACVGLDCVNNENFSFDTIRLKENNTRISFVDTSSSAGFATEDWTIRANSNASGGGNFLAFVDRGASSPGDETGTIVFEVDAGAPANALRVSSTGKVGIRTATPALDVHMNTTDTPAIRMEQNNSGGFTAQTWDIGGNEANWFVRDVTGGSRLPLRIRPGAPTSSVDIAASGNVGIGTPSPGDKLEIAGSSGNITIGQLFGTSYNSIYLNGLTGTGNFNFLSKNGDQNLYINRPSGKDIRFRENNVDQMTILTAGNVGIGTAAPTATLSVNGTANKPGGGSWDVFSDERLKNINGRFTPGLSAVMRLQPLRYQYKANNPVGLTSGKDYVGFGAQELQKVLPEAVSENANGYLQVNNDPIIWTMLNAIKEQQKEIEQLKGQVKKLQTTSHRRRK
jgi:hypothetical protein